MRMRCPPDEEWRHTASAQDVPGKSFQLKEETRKREESLNDPPKQARHRHETEAGFLLRRNGGYLLAVESRLVMCRPEISTKRVTRKSGNTRTEARG